MTASSPHISQARSLLLVLGLYTLITIAFTWPVILNFSSGNYGYSGDSPLAMWELWTTRFEWTGGRTPDELVGLPFGGGNFNRQHLPLYFAITSLGPFPNEVFAFNFFAFVSFPLCGLAAWLLAYRITGDRRASFVAGLIFAFGPAHYYQARDHFSFDPQWMAFFLLALWYMEERPSIGRALLTALAYSITITAFPYYAYFAMIMGITLIGSRALFFGCRQYFGRERLLAYLIAASVVAAVVAAAYWKALSAFIAENQSDSYATGRPRVYLRDPTWPFYLSARPWDYVLPSDDHLVFGELSRNIRKQISSIRRGNWVPEAYRYLDLDSNWFWNGDTGPLERTLFLSITGMALSFYTIWRFWRAGSAAIGQPAERRYGVVLFMSLAAVGLLFSAPPWFPVGSLFAKWLPKWAENLIIPLPLWLSFQVLPIFRAAVRFGIVVLLGTAVLAAVGLATILAQTTKRRVRIGLTLATSLIVLFEFANIPPYTRIYPPPAVYEWLANQPNGIVASHPWNTASDRQYQPVHKKPLAAQNGITAPFPLATIQTYALKNMSDPQTLSKLTALHVRYLVWHNEAPTAPPFSVDAGLRLLRDFDTAAVYEVTASPSLLVALYTPNSDVWISDAQWQWHATEQIFWVWNPSSQPAQIEVSLELIGASAGTMTASPSLTAPPDSIIIDGILRPNPLAAMSYASTDYSAEVLAGRPSRLFFPALRILPGETRFLLKWVPADAAVGVRSLVIRLLPVR